jgi:hypothetical protein
MTKFKKTDFCYHGGYLTYAGQFFVARFKYGNPGKSKNHFVKFLVANFTVEEYRALYATGLAPTEILKTKGFVPYNTYAGGAA